MEILQKIYAEKKDLENKNIKKKKLLSWRHRDNQEKTTKNKKIKQVLRWQANIGTGNNVDWIAPSRERNRTGDKDVGFQTPQNPKQQNQPRQTAMQDKLSSATDILNGIPIC